MEQKIDERLQNAAMEYYPTMPPKTLGNNNVMDKDFKQSYMRDAFIAGAKWQKEQMMAKGVETTFNVSLPSGLYDELWIKDCKEGDKLLVIKKDEL